MNSFRGGMQVHAVPDDERATDSRGQQLPWGYSYSDASLNRKQPVERGPFGRPASRRATSRSKTATPGPKDDPANLENMKTIDEMFGKLKKPQGDKDTKAPREQRPPVVTPRPSQSQSAIDAAAQPAQTAPPGGQAATFKEPTEVLIYGYPGDQLAGALEFFESASHGRIYEDYDRAPPTPRYGTLLHQVHASLPRSLPPTIRRKINTYSGGDHWIKVTFDSPEAAERACFFSPTPLHGFLIHAEPWRGVGPTNDAPIPVNPAGPSGARTLKQRRPMQPGQRDAFSSMPTRLQSAPGMGQQQSPEPHKDNNGSPDTSETLSSATVGAAGSDTQQQQQPDRAFASGASTSFAASPASSRDQKPLRIQGATRAVLRPHTEAFLPVPPWSQRTFGHIPLLGALFGGDPNAKPGQGGGIIGNAVPRKDDGTFDWANASTYWRLCWRLDYWLGTDLCGMKGDD